MNTTAFFVEILVIGIQSSIWVALMVAALLGYDWFPAAKPFLDSWSGLLTIVIMALCYTLGIVVDRLADAIFTIVSPKQLLLKSVRIRKMTELMHNDVRMVVLAKEGGVSPFLDYVRSRVRIIRATTLNIILIAIGGLAFIQMRCDSLGCASKTNLSFSILGIGVILCVITLFALAMLQITYEKRLEQAGHEIEKGHEKAKK